MRTAHCSNVESMKLSATWCRMGSRRGRVQLLATNDAALERVGDDPGRALSKDPQLLRLAYERFESLLPTMGAFDWTFDTTTMSSQAVADVLAAALLRGATLSVSTDGGPCSTA